MYMTTAAKGNNKTLFSAHSALAEAHNHLSDHHAGIGSMAFNRGDHETADRHYALSDQHKSKALAHNKAAKAVYLPGVDKKALHSNIGLTVGTKLFKKPPEKAHDLIKHIHKTMGTGSKNMQKEAPPPVAPKKPNYDKSMITPQGFIDHNGKNLGHLHLTSPTPKAEKHGRVFGTDGKELPDGTFKTFNKKPERQGRLFDHQTGKEIPDMTFQSDKHGNITTVPVTDRHLPPKKSVPAATAHYAKSHAHQSLADHHQDRADHHQTMADTHKAVGHSLNPAPASQHGSMFAKVGKLFKKSVGNKVSGAANFLKNTANKGHQAIHSYLDKKLAA